MQSKESNQTHESKKVSCKPFNEFVSAEPMSACDILKALLQGERWLVQKSPCPKVELEERDNSWGIHHQLIQRAKYACDLNLVLHPDSLVSRAGEKRAYFISKDKYHGFWQEAAKEYENKCAEDGAIPYETYNWSLRPKIY